MLNQLKAIICLLEKLRTNMLFRLAPIMALSLFLTQTSLAAPSDLDNAFGSSGIVSTNISSADDEARAIAVQSDGKIVVGGNSGAEAKFTLARYLENGALDSTFGAGGIVQTDINGFDLVYAIAIQQDGKIVAAGDANGLFGVVRYNTNGTLDTSFGTGGKVITGISGKFASISSIVLSSDGKIVAVGNTSTGGDFVIARYTPTGALDTTFDGDGIVMTDFGSEERASSVKIQTDGKIVVVGSTLGMSGNNFAVARYNTDGSLDASFDADGKVITTVAGAAYSVDIQSNGKIVVAGSGDDFYLTRYKTDGSLDETFSADGIVSINAGGMPDNAYGVKLDTLGKIIIAGSTISGKSGNEDFVVARVLNNGDADTTFDGGGDGIQINHLGTNSDIAYAVTLQSNGRILLAGSKGDFGSKEFAITRYLGTQTPTAATATLGGRVTNAVGGGISGARLMLSGGSMTEPRYAIANSFGYYNFYDVPVGATYTVSVNAKGYTFTQSTIVVNLMGDYTNANFVAD